MDPLLIVLLAAMFVAALLAWGVRVGGNASGARFARVDPEAYARAERLVQAVLSERERRQLKEQGYLEVPSRLQSGRLYRIPARPGLVEQVDPNGRRRLLCLVPMDPIPDPEVVLVHKLWLEADEAQYLRLANRIPLWPDAMR